MSNKFKANIELSENDNHVENTSAEYITITEDKLINYSKDLYEGLKSRVLWQPSLTLFVTLVITLLTVTFKDNFGKTADFWESFFFFAAIASFIWFLYAIYKLYKNHKKGNVEYFINRVKGNEE